MKEKKYVLAIDSGSTGIRAIVFNHKGEIIAREYKKTPANYPEPGAIEQNPEMMWESLLDVVKTCFSKNKIDPKEIIATGISNQRGTFCLWEKATGKPICNFISCNVDVDYS